MTTIGTQEHPLRVAVIGCGPSGFYIVQSFFQQKGLVAEIDMFDRLPTPFGLVRFGVAPDHQKVKAVTKLYNQLGTKPGVRFFGNVAFGRDVTLEELTARYHQIAFTTGAQTDRRLGIPGEDLAGSHPATEFVAWYNGHPEFKDLEFDLSCERAVVVGVGNVAVDVARILCRTPEELGRTDIADYALDALRESKVKEVYLVGRRGPAQAAFTNSEIEELGKLEDADTITLSEEATLDDLSARHLEEHPDRLVRSKVAVLASYSKPRKREKGRKLYVRFLVSPTQIHDDGNGRVKGVRMVRNELYASDDGSLRPRATEAFEELEAGLVFRSVGYRGVALPGLPFHEAWGILPNEQGRIVEDDRPLAGLYAAGWIKRGPSGVIGTNRPDANETVKCMVEDLTAGTLLAPTDTNPASITKLLDERGVTYITFADWQRLDEIEVARGKEQGRPRVKFVTVEEITAALGR